MTQQVVKIKSIKHVTHDVLQITTEKPRQLDFTPGPKDVNPVKAICKQSSRLYSVPYYRRHSLHRICPFYSSDESEQAVQLHGKKKIPS